MKAALIRFRLPLDSPVILFVYLFLIILFNIRARISLSLKGQEEKIYLMFNNNNLKNLLLQILNDKVFK